VGYRQDRFGVIRTFKGIRTCAGQPTGRPSPRDGVQTIGIDFWHAVEFSRSGRASIEPFRAVFEATLLPYQVILARSNDLARIAHPCRAPTHPGNDVIVSGSRRAFPGGRPGTGHLIGVRYSLSGNARNLTEVDPASSNRNARPRATYAPAPQRLPAPLTGRETAGRSPLVRIRASLPTRRGRTSRASPA